MGRMAAADTLGAAVELIAENDWAATLILNEILSIGHETGAMEIAVAHVRAIDDLGWYGAVLSDVYVRHCSDDMSLFMSHVRRESGLDKIYPYLD